jgi:hypothetical protein
MMTSSNIEGRSKNAKMLIAKITYTGSPTSNKIRDMRRLFL